MRYVYANDNDITAAFNLDHEDRAIDAVLRRIQDVMSDLGEIPFSPYCD